MREGYLSRSDLRNREHAGQVDEGHLAGSRARGSPLQGVRHSRTYVIQSKGVRDYCRVAGIVVGNSALAWGAGPVLVEGGSGLGGASQPPPRAL